MLTPTKDWLEPGAPTNNGGGYLTDEARRSPNGIMVIRNGVIVDANDAGARMMDFDDGASLRGRPFTDFVAPRYRETMVERDRARNNGATVPNEYLFMGLGAKGRQAPVQIRLTRVDLPCGPVTVAAFQELTDPTEDAPR